MELFDSHAHLESERYDDDREQVIARAVAAGVTRILTCGSDLETSAQSVALAQTHVGLYAAVGIHGHRATTAMRAEGEEAPGRIQDSPLQGSSKGGQSGPGRGEPRVRPLAEEPDAFSQLAELAQQPGVVAIGEIGLDYHYDFSPRQAQRMALGHQLLLARDLDLPVILHNRESDDDLRAIVTKAPPVRGVLHCFLADETMAAWALDRGLYLGVAGPITFSNVQHLAPILRGAPLDRLLIETDSPYLAPHPLRGKRNEPAYVVHVAQALAEVLGLPVEELALRTTENACRLFGVDAGAPAMGES